MDICYVDESGSADLLCTSTVASTPVLAVVGLIVPDGHLKDVIWGFLQIKKDFNPSLTSETTQLSDLIKTEIKGSNLRADLRKSGRNNTRRVFGMLDRIFDLLEKHHCQVIAQVTVKYLDVPLNDRVIYGASIGWICRTFHQYLMESQQTGLVILDSRTKVKNTGNADVITTQIFRHGGDPFHHFAEVPVFGHSDSHVVLQIADIIASTVVFPAACSAFCSHLTWNHHAHPGYEKVRSRYGLRLKKLQYRYLDKSVNQWRGGIYPQGALNGVGAPAMFAPPDSSPRLPGIVETSEVSEP